MFFSLCLALSPAFALCFDRRIPISQQLWLTLGAHPGGAWKECPADTLQGGETVPSSKTPLGSCSPSTSVGCDVCSPAQDLPDVPAVSQAAGKLSQLPPTQKTFYHGWVN